MTANPTDTDESHDVESTDATTGGETSDEPSPSPGEDNSTGARAMIGGSRSLVEYVQWGLLAVLLLLVLIATFRFYFSASTAVDRFVTRQYRPLFQAAFNLVILLIAGVGLSLLVRRLS